MGTYILRRLLLMIPTLVGITLLVFLIVAGAPGGIGASLKVQGGQMDSQKSVAVQQAYLEDRYGLDDPLLVQYARWFGRISPIKFGARDQIGPSGDRIRVPKAPKRPPVWEWFAKELPVAAKAAPFEPGLQREARIAAYKAADRAYAQARSDYVGVSALLKQALGEYAKERGIPRGADAKGQGRPEVLARHEPDTSSPAWPRVQELGEQAVAAYKRAIDAREVLAAAFHAKPYPQAGIPIIPGVLSLSAPDFGVAYSRQRPVMDLILSHLPVTLLINAIAFPIIYMVAIPGGMLAATHRGSALDVGLGGLFIALWSVPVVLAGVLSIGFLASRDYLGAFPVSGLHANNAAVMRYLPGADAAGNWTPGYLLDMLWHMCLPVLCLVYTGFAVLSKQTRAAMLDNFNADYVRTAKAKGVASKDIVLKHVFRNSLLPLITMFVTIFPAMLAGSVVVERIFTVPGMGRLLLEAIDLRDRELILANTLMIATVNLLALLLADILYAIADPRVTYK